MLIMALVPVLTFGQELYRPFLEEGKVWTYYYYNDMTGHDFCKSLIVRGDTIIDNREYKRIVNAETESLDCTMREEGKKVFVSYPNTSGETLLYDFSLNKGDSFPLDGGGEGSNASSLAIVVSVDTIIVDGNAYRALDVRPKGDSLPNWWVEGIGGMYYLTANFQLVGNNYNFSLCQLNGETLFADKDFQALGEFPSSIQKILKSASNDGIYNLQGQRLSTMPQKGVYIQNGKKKLVKK